ncbi:MAG: T9SS type A sorting domain-containing protein [Algibacter sp.]
MKLFNLNNLLLFSIFFISTIFYTSAQNKDTSSCDTRFSTENQEYIKSLKPQIKKFEKQFSSLSSTFSKSSNKTLKNSIPIKAHIIRSSNGKGGLSTSDLNLIIDNLNATFSGAYFEFYLSDGINYIDNDAFCHFNRKNEDSLTETNNVSGLINIYFTDFLENASKSSICGYTNTIGRSDVILMKNDCAKNGSSLAHEIGHLFSLMHTHGADGDELTTELVDGSNCDTDGDGICDTPADPKINSNSVDNFCSFTEIILDANGDRFQPDAQNIMSYSKKACRSHFSQQQLARMFAFYKSAKNYYSSPSFNADFDVDVNQTCENTLTVHFNGNCENITKWEWDVDGDGNIDYTTKTPTHTFNTGIYNVSLTVSNKTQSISRTYYNYIKVGVLKSTPFIENFEDFTIASDKGWTANDVSENGYNWLINSGDTSTEGTGPTFDNSIETTSGTYIYAEASGAQIGDIAEFISPCIEINQSNTLLEFAYHMFGENMGELHVDIQTDSGFKNDIIQPLTGQAQNYQDDDYLIQTIDLSNYKDQTIKIRFRAIRGASWDSDIAIDDISIKGQTDTEPNYSKALIVKVYPNPVSGEILYIQSTNPEEILNYSISNLVGQNFMQGIVYNNNINLSKLNKGTYLLKLQCDNSTVIKKVIK